MDDNCYQINDDYLDDDDDGIMYSTKDYRSDSDEEDLAAFLLKKTKKRSKFSDFEDDDSDEDDKKMDDFEKDMAAELKATMEKILAPYISKPSTSGEEKAEESDTHYDEIYFDSDEDNDFPAPKGRKDKHKVISNDDLFYDPLMDDEDQAWVDNNRRKYQLRSKKLTKDGKIKPQALPHSDAVLNCPACFCTLCHDCQRHEIYKNQYRAMFVFNCIVDKSERLRFAIKEDKKKKFKKGKKNKRKSIEQDVSKMEVASFPQDLNQNLENKIVNDATSQNTDKNSVTNDVNMSQDTSQNSENKDGNAATSKDTSQNPSGTKDGNAAISQETSQNPGMTKDGNAATSQDTNQNPGGTKDGHDATSQDPNQNPGGTVDGNDAIFYPVRCSFCNTKIAVQDEEEVYHFFNVLTSY